MGAELAVVDRGELSVGYGPQELAARLQSMKQSLSLVQTFFKEVMVEKQDYGVIPGTDKPTLLKPGAEKLCELYGYAITIKHLDEMVDRQTGFYRAKVTVALVHRQSGVIIAEGVGEANTMEGRYRYRWVPQWKLPKGFDVKSLHCEERKNRNGETYRTYRMENDDPYTLWNTVLKMAKKRGLVDAALSATRSSGIFTQDLEDLQGWVAGGAPIDADFTVTESPPAKGQDAPAGSKQQPATGEPLCTQAQRNKLLELSKKLGLTPATMVAAIKDRYGKAGSKDLSDREASAMIADLEAKVQQANEHADLGTPVGNPDDEGLFPDGEPR